jgi:DNA polymerase delta subunit 4
MPPKRRGADRTSSASRQQSTLSFNGKTSRVTKASQQHQQLGKSLDKKKEALFDEVVSRTDAQPEDDDVVEIATKPTTAEKAIEQQAAVETRALGKASSVNDEEVLTGGAKTEDVLGGRAQTSDVGAVGGPVGSGWVGDEEKRARKITEIQIKKFWREKENDRLVPRVHQEDLGVHERVLRLWDVSGEYGVSSDFHNPRCVTQLLTNPQQPCIGIARLKRWKRANVLGLKPPIEVLAVLLKEMDSADSVKVQRAYVDSLMSSRFIET